MIIRSIRLQNFGLYAGNQSIDPAVQEFHSGPITLVGGLNGRGKTSLLEAVLLNLYGSRSPMVRERARSYSAYLDSLTHRGVPREEGGAVELELVVPIEGDPTYLRIRRSWKAANVRVVDRLEIWRDGLTDAHLADNWDTYVEELIPSGISGLFFFDGEKIGALAEAEDISEPVRAAIRSLLGLDLVDRLIADLNLVIKRNQAHIDQVPGSELISQLESELEELVRTRSKTKMEMARLQNQLERAQEALRQKEQAYLQSGGLFAQKRDRLQQEQQELQQHLADIKARIALLAAGPLPMLLIPSLLAAVQKGVEHDHRIRQARTLLPVLTNRDQGIVERLKEGSGLDVDALSRIEAFLRSDRQELEKLASEPPRFNLSGTTQGQLADILRAGQTTLREEAKDLLKAYQETSDKLEFVNQHLLFRVDEEAVSDTLRELTDLAKQVAELEHQKLKLQKDLESLEYSIEQTQKRRKAAFDTVFEQTDALDDAKRTIQLALRSQETMRTFSVQLTERKIDQLARAVSTAFRDLMQKSNLVWEVRIHPQTFEIRLYDATGHEVPKARLSSGEKQMLAIAILWGLARASGRELPVIIDTPMGRLDSSHRMNFVTKYLPNASHQVIVLSTDTEIIGPYWKSLNGAIGRQYLLRYNEADKCTTIEDGYFHTREGATA